jgi:hypothetical protein
MSSVSESSSSSSDHSSSDSGASLEEEKQKLFNLLLFGVKIFKFVWISIFIIFI